MAKDYNIRFCDFNNDRRIILSEYFIGGIAKLVMPRIANPTCVGSSPTTSSTFL